MGKPHERIEQRSQKQTPARGFSLYKAGKHGGLARAVRDPWQGTGRQRGRLGAWDGLWPALAAACVRAFSVWVFVIARFFLHLPTCVILQ